MAEISFKVAVITFSVDQISFVVAEITFKVAVIIASGQDHFCQCLYWQDCFYIYVFLALDFDICSRYQYAATIELKKQI